MQESPVRNRDDSDAYAFRPVRRSDLPMLGQWLHVPQVSRWWGEPAEQLALLEADLEEPGMITLICLTYRVSRITSIT